MKLKMTLLATVAFAATSFAALAQTANDYHARVTHGSVVGSAFSIEDGSVLTNAHVVSGLYPGSRVHLTSPTGTQVTGRVSRINYEMDIALISVPSGFIPIVQVNPNIRNGMQVTAAGIAAGPGDNGGRLSLKGEIVRETYHAGLYSSGQMVLRMPGTRPGSSGGPILDSNGYLIGMITAVDPVDTTRTSAVRSDTILDEVKKMKRSKVRHRVRGIRRF